MSTALIYIALNVLLFGTLFCVGKALQWAVWKMIINYDKLVDFQRRKP
jgi:hypothetical protein